MNLIQLQDDLKSMPLQALQAYMNGMNPEVPPYLAAAEMQRRQSMMQREEMRQGAEQGNMPSVKEQLEQAAGLMALQQERAQQAQQQMAEQGMQAPMPAGEMTPQPQRQPQPAGLPGLPVEMGMRMGGIVGYQVGGVTGRPPEDIPGEPTAEDAKAEAERILKRELDEQKPQDRSFIQMVWDRLKQAGLRATAGGDLQTMPARAAMGIASQIGGADPSQMPPAAPSATRPQQRPPMPGADAQIARSQTRAQDVQNMGMQPRPVPPVPSPRPEAEEAGLPAAMPPQPQTPMQRGIEAEREVFEASGLGGLADRRKQMEEQFSQSAADRRMEGLMETLAGGVRGFGGMAAGSVAAGRRERAEKEALARQMYGLERGEGEARYDGIRAMTDELMKPAGDKSTETERLMAQVNQLKAEGRHAEAQALIDLNRQLRFPPDRQRFSREDLVKQAMQSWDKLSDLERMEYAEQGVDRRGYVEDYVKAFESILGEEGVLERQRSSMTPTSATPTSGAQSSLNPKALADQIRQQREGR